MVLVVALGSVFAAKSSLFASKSVPDTKIGVQMGYGARSFTLTEKATGAKNSINVKNSGFYAAGTFEFGVANNVALKVEGGINTMGQSKTTMYLAGNSIGSDTSSENTPVNFTVFAGVVYDLPLNDKLSLDLGAGMDVMIGKLSSADNAAFGLGLEAGVSIDVAKNISIVGGGKFGWHFLNSNDDVQGWTGSENHSTSNITYKFFGGLAYSL